MDGAFSMCIFAPGCALNAFSSLLEGGASPIVAVLGTGSTERGHIGTQMSQRLGW